MCACSAASVGSTKENIDLFFQEGVNDMSLCVQSRGVRFMSKPP